MKNKCPFLCLLSFIAQFYFSAANTIQDIARIQFSPTYIHSLLEGQNVTVNVRIKFDSDEFFNSEFYNKPFKVSVKTLHNEVATSDIEIIEIDPIDLKVMNESLEYNFNTTIDTHFMGKTALQVRLISVDSISKSDGNLITLMELSTDDERQDFGSELKPIKGASRMDLWVIREKDYNIHELKLPYIWETIKSPISPLIGCFSQFILMPLLAYAISITILLPLGLNSFALGLFVTGCSPSGGASNFWTLLLEGNVNLSITMTFLSTIASVGKFFLSL
uniref:Uncharacterized protein n=1 Tax=Panagrolaimus davidi TaxID=227884 RepID=A0A914PWL4_9BILA